MAHENCALAELGRNLTKVQARQILVSSFNGEKTRTRIKLGAKI
jgi:hypothetical protein